MQKLGEIAEISTGFPFEGHKYTSIGIRVVRGENIGQGELRWDEKVDKRWNESTSALDNYWLYEGDIVMQMDGNVGKNIARIYTADPMLIAQRVACIRAKEKCSQDYIYGILRTKLFKNYIERCATGTSIKHISLQQISDFEFDFHLPEIQAKLGRLIADIDDKIRVNRQINDNLEAMAKQLYDYWFVQFDFPNEEGKPYKSSGGAMVWNDKLKRKIPQGWDFCFLEDLLTIRNGRDHKHLADGIYPVYGSGGEMRKASEYLYDGESVLMPRKGSLNNIMYVNESFWTVDTMFYSEMKLSNCAKYIYYTIKDIDFTRWDSGTGVPSMTSSTLYSIKLVKPQNETLKKFDEMISPLFEHMKQISGQNVVLTKQRDELLPLLMNGQASVNYHLSDD